MRFWEREGGGWSGDVLCGREVVVWSGCWGRGAWLRLVARVCLGGLASVEEAAGELGDLLVVERACARVYASVSDMHMYSTV